jgi:hypothetical protein
MRVLLEMKRQINWQEQNLNTHSQNLNQLVASHLEWKPQKILGIHNWTERGKRSYIRVLCQKNEGSVEIKQRPNKMGGRTTYRTLSFKRAPFQIGID